MEIFLIILAILLIFALVIAPCIVSGKCSREEEYRNLNPKILDDERKWDEDIYDEYFIKKEDEDEKRDNLGK